MSDVDSITSKQYIKILFPYAYNILGAVEEAKDAVQDVLLKHLLNKRNELADEKNYLIRAVINTAINLKNRQKKMRRSETIWLPEPVATDDTSDNNLYLNDILSYSLLILMERLTAKERAVFILKETFDYAHTEIADILSITEENSRKLLSRAKISIFKPGQKRTDGQTAHEREILGKLMHAIRQRDIQALENTMASDIRFYADGGGKVPLLAAEKRGSEHVAALLMVAYDKYLQYAEIDYALINHQPALLTYSEGRLKSCQVFDLQPLTGLILRINIVLDPGKLSALSQKNLTSSFSRDRIRRIR